MLEGGLAVLQVEGGLAVLVLLLLSEVSVPLFSLSLKSLDPLRMSRLFRRGSLFAGTARRSVAPFRSCSEGLDAGRSRLPRCRSGGCWC